MYVHIYVHRTARIAELKHTLKRIWFAVLATLLRPGLRLSLDDSCATEAVVGGDKAAGVS